MFEDEDENYLDAIDLELEAQVQQVQAPTMTNQTTIKTSVDLPVYSGHPVNTKDRKSVV